MAKQVGRPTLAKRVKIAWTNPWNRKHYILLAIGLGIIIVGFGLLSTGIVTSWDNPLAVSVAPVVLVIGYCVAIPWAIMYLGKQSAK